MSEVSKHTYLFAAHIGTVNDKHWLIFDRNRDAANTIFFFHHFVVYSRREKKYALEPIYVFVWRENLKIISYAIFFIIVCKSIKRQLNLDKKCVYINFPRKKNTTRHCYIGFIISKIHEIHTHTHETENQMWTLKFGDLVHFSSAHIYLFR